MFVRPVLMTGPSAAQNTNKGMIEKAAVVTSRDWHGVVAAALLMERCQLPEKGTDLFFVPVCSRPRIDLDAYDRAYITGNALSARSLADFLKAHAGIVIGNKRVSEIGINVEISFTWSTSSPFVRCRFDSKKAVQKVARLLQEEKRWACYAHMLSENADDLKFRQITKELRHTGNVLGKAKIKK